jgi:hypothetical protein
MRILGKFTFAALMGASALALTSAGASARVVCNDEGDCWHVATEYQYAPDFGVVIHPDDWKWKEGEKHQWREHEGRGYWRKGTWMPF